MYAFIDESGDHNLDITTIDNNYNVFVLGIVLIPKNKYEAIDKEFKCFKKDFFGGDDFVIHTAELIRPTHKKFDPRNKILLNKDKREYFYNHMTDFLEKIEFIACFAVIRKINFNNSYMDPIDPYDLAFENILNRILYYSKSNKIEIHPECRNTNKLDKRLIADFNRYSEVGIKFHESDEIKKRIAKFELKDKKENNTGLQIADLLVSPVGRHFLGKSPRPKGNEIPYISVKNKLAGPLALTIFP